MEYPSITQYKEAVLFQESFEAEELKCLRPVMDGSEPVMTSGNFAVVFKMHNPQTGETFALKCFTQDQDGRAEAYRQIMEEMRYVRSPYFLNLQYIERGIWAGNYDWDEGFPVVLMPWVEGEPLDQHIIRLARTNPERLHLVAYEFSVMASWLVNQPFAHGDIKPDNILVRADGAMVLVDYDGLFVPSMLGAPSREAGTPAFRHPNRPTMPFDERIDDFPLASINLSLYLIALQPELLQKYGAKDRLLFTETDYQNLSQCKLLKEILALCHDAQLQRLYALFFIALSEGSLERCENRLMLLRPPRQDFGILRQPYANPVPVEGTNTQSMISPKDELVIRVNGTPPKDIVIKAKGVQFRMKYVEGGCFMMGAPDDDVEALDNEKPSHKVSLDSYYIAETLVTQELWEVVMGTNVQEKSENGTYGHYLKGIGPNHPMYYITWDDCQEFIHKLNGLNLIRQKFSLPSEAQWEFAARGGIKSKGYKYSGSNELDSVAYCRTNSKQTHSVAEKKANELGLYDMTGNVWEWCQDSYDENYYTKSPIQNPLCSVNSDIRVSRGGAFKSNLEWYRLSYRNLEKSNVSYYGIGMRLVINIK